MVGENELMIILVTTFGVELLNVIPGNRYLIKLKFGWYRVMHSDIEIY
jgi:hypothetical protein